MSAVTLTVKDIAKKRHLLNHETIELVVLQSNPFSLSNLV